MEIIVLEKSVYGQDLIYPICDKAKAFAELLGTKTLTKQAIHGIKKLGYKVITQEKQKEL